MNKQYVEVYIKWFKEYEQWAERSNCIRFCTQIRLEEEGEDKPIWTAEIIIKKFSDPSSCYADLKYLFEHAPNHLLKKGKSFALFDGPNQIANGKIIG